MMEIRLSISLLLVITAGVLGLAAAIITWKYIRKIPLFARDPVPLEENSIPITHPPMVHLVVDRLDELNNQIEKLMQSRKPYLQQGYSLFDLSNELGVPIYQVSFFLNQVKGMNFPELLNEYRIQYSQELMQIENSQHLTMESIAFQSGFGNRNSFTAAFKKFTGTTPSAFLKEIRQGKGTGSQT